MYSYKLIRKFFVSCDIKQIWTELRTDLHVELVDGVVRVPVRRLVGAQARSLAQHRTWRWRGRRIIRISKEK